MSSRRTAANGRPRGQVDGGLREFLSVLSFLSDRLQERCNLKTEPD